MSTNLLLVSPYNVNFYGGVQNQVKLFKDGLDKTNFNVRILAPDSSDYNIGNSFKIPFNGSNNPVSLLPNKKIVFERFLSVSNNLGLVSVAVPKKLILKKYISDSYHKADYNLFWVNIRKNLLKRLSKIEDLK